MWTKVKSVRVEMWDSVDVWDTLVINNSCRFSTAKLPTKVSDLANDCCYLTEEALSCAVCWKADKEYVDCCLSAKQDCWDYALNCDLTSWLNSKQDVIDDLSTIRANACCGKAAHTTIWTYWDIVTHDACEFQEAWDYALNCTMTACLACKYDASNPCCYQTATEVACTVSPKADKTYVDCCIGELENDIEQLQWRGKFLSNWDATTWKPETDPETLPYEYHTWDYYMVTVVGSNNKRPTWSSYTWEASTTAETSELAEWDMYAYDGTNWLLQSNHGKTVSFANLSWVPSDNACLCSELASKQDNIDDLNTIRTNACCGKSASDTIATYWDVVTHNACEFQVAWDYATNSTLEWCLACKQNNISDLDTIRTNACCWACAKTIISWYWDIVSHNASEFQAAWSYAQCCDLTTWLSWKVDKVNWINRIYWTDWSWCQTDYAYSDTVTGNSIAKRDACGNLCVADPTCNSHAATKWYVDDKVDNKVICWWSIAWTLTCQTDLQTALNCKQDNISDLDSIRTWAGKWDTAVQPWDLAAVATSGKYCDLTWIPCATTWGTAIAVTNWQVSVCYDNNTIKVNNSDQIYADYTWLQKTCNLVTNFSNADDTHYPSAKAVADIVEWMSWGNMIKEIYDPCNCRKNMYDMDNMYDWSVNKVVTSTEKALWDAKQEALTLPSNPTCWHLVVWWANKKTFVDWWEIPNSATWWCITGTLSNQTDLQNALNCKAQCCDIPTDNCQLANSCWYTTCTGTLTENSLKTVNGCSLVGSGDICIEWGWCSEWWCITGTLCDQTDLQWALDDKVNICDCYTYWDFTKCRSFFWYNDCYGIAIECCGCWCNQWGFLRPDSLEISYNCNGHVVWSDMRSWYTSLFEYDWACDNCCVCIDFWWICVCWDCVTDKCYPFDWCCRIATLCDLPAESNVKAFYITWNSWESNLSAWQAALDWLCSWKSPIISCNWVEFYLSRNCSGCSVFSTEIGGTNCNNSSFICCKAVYLYKCEDTTTLKCITISSPTLQPGYLAVWVNYNCSYTPQYPWSPTTKKYVDDKVYMWDTAPATAVEGQIWSDTCSNMVKYYDWSQWNVLTAWGSTWTWDVTGPNSSVDWHIAVFDSTSWKIIKDWWPIPEWKSYCAWEGIDIEEKIVRDTQWPAPYWFHVPTIQEWICVCVAFDAVKPESSCTIFWWLNMPCAWYLCYSNGTAIHIWDGAYYWTSSPYSDSTGLSCAVYGTTWMSYSYMYRGCWYPIRAFKDIPVVPDENRTEISSSWGGGIYCNCTLWLFSVSKDGSTWYTIADKNIWATVAYNYWDTLCKENIWCYYQRWNNYWFDCNWVSTWSTSRVDASGYWPWNYYCNKQFITCACWDCGYNSNLWWWVTNCCLPCNTIENSWIRSFNGCTWDVCFTAGSWIRIVDKNDLQWPAPKWFHVPSAEERKNLISCMCCLWLWSCTSFFCCLGLYKRWCIAVNWCRCGYNSSAYYWTATPLWNCAQEARISTNVCICCSYRGKWLPIRAFKNSPTIPDSSWTVVADKSSCADGAWIFKNDDAWVISISSDGINWLSIASRDLWWWGFYQWWNNFEVPGSWGYCISDTQVDATWYWPWNYYCGNAFITTSASPYDWSCVKNDNLWWWVNWEVYENAIINTTTVTSATTPKNPTKWLIWYDTTNDELKTYDWACWNIAWGDAATVVSWDTWCIYTLKVSNSAPAAWTPNSTITFVIE